MEQTLQFLELVLNFWSFKKENIISIHLHFIILGFN